MNTKNLLQSKTFWVQIIAFIAALLPVVQEWIAKNPESTIAVLGAVNVLVRFATSGRVTLFGALGSNGDMVKSEQSGGIAPLWVLACMTAGFGMGLPSCTVTTAADGSTVTKPDAEGIALGMQLAEWAVWLAQTQDGKTQDAREEVPSAK